MRVLCLAAVVALIGAFSMHSSAYRRPPGAPAAAATVSPHIHTGVTPHPEKTTVQSPIQSTILHVVAKGVDTPDAIPESVAYRHWLRVTAIGANATAREKSRRDAFVAQIGLSANDRALYVAALAGVQEALSSIASERKQLSPSDPTAAIKVATLKDLEVQQFVAAQDRLQAWLSPEGVKRLATHIQTVKRGIVIYSDR
jgi:hypothetical protein